MIGFKRSIKFVFENVEGCFVNMRYIPVPLKATKLCSTSYIRSFVVYLQVPFAKLKVCLLDF